MNSKQWVTAAVGSVSSDTMRNVYAEIRRRVGICRVMKTHPSGKFTEKLF